MKQTFDDIQSQFRGNRKLANVKVIVHPPIMTETSVQITERERALGRMKRSNEFSKLVDQWMD